VEIPEGSSSAAPVINPGPRTAKDFFRTPVTFLFLTFSVGKCFLAVSFAGRDILHQDNQGMRIILGLNYAESWKSLGELLAAPGLAIVSRDPDFAGGGYDPAVLRVGKFNAGDVSAERSAG
jgi:hypothetical protein